MHDLKSPIRNRPPRPSAGFALVELPAVSDAKRALRLRSGQAAFTLVELLITIAVIVILAGIGLTVGGNLVRSNEIRRTKTILANCMQIATEYEVSVGTPPNHLATVGEPFVWNNIDRLFNSPAGLPDNPSNKNDKLEDERSTTLANFPDRRKLDFQEKSIERFVWVTMRVSALKKLYASFRPEVLVDKDLPLATGPDRGFLELRDAWNKKLIYVTYVRHNGFMPTGQRDTDTDTFFDGSDDDDDDVDDFLPVSEAYYFASAGPDGKWGHAKAALIADDEAAAYAESEDGGDLNKTRTRLAEEASDNVYSTDVLEGN